jgi:aryl-alcohol dehydrogenase-like predicted oxidoreductase
MQTRRFGTSGLEVPVLGLGAGQLGDPSSSDDDVRRLLHGAVDLGVTLIDTARSYGASEDRIGRHLAPVRDRLILSTKLGYGIAGVADWTADAVTAGIDDALATLRTDWIDIVHLHSCDAGALARGDVIDALDRAVAAGKVRVAGYSGDNDALDLALASGRFAGLQCSVSLCDQGAIERVCRPAAAAGLGVIAKRPLANAPWRYAGRPVGREADKYWSRFRALELPDSDLSWPELAIRFAVFAPGVATAITGTGTIDHLRDSVEAVARGPLPDRLLDAIRAAWSRRGASWPGVI